MELPGDAGKFWSRASNGDAARRIRSCGDTSGVGYWFCYLR